MFDLRHVALGAMAGAAQLAAAELAAALLPWAGSPAQGLGAWLIDRTPGPAVDMTVATVESLDKPLLAAGLTLESLGAGMLAARIPTQRHRGVALLAHGALTGAAAASRPQASRASSLAAGMLGGAVGACALRPVPLVTSWSRIVATGALAVTAGGLTLGLRRRVAREHAVKRAAVTLPPPCQTAPPTPPDVQFDIAGLSPLWTAPTDFYVTDVAFPAPRVDPQTWRLRVCGLVRRELELSLDELLAMPLVELDATLACVHNPVGGPRIGTGRWLGVPLAHVLERAGPRPGAEQLVARSVDGFSAGLPISYASGEQALVVLGLAGQPLPVAHGFPARLLVPGLWGADANTKWLSALELTTWNAVADYWDSRGWPRVPGAVRPGSRIDVPAHRSRLPCGPVTVAGVAWAPPAGVIGVELSVDGGPWLAAELAAELAPTAWRQWRYAWHAHPGPHELRVRTHSRAAVQSAKREPPYPRGSGGHHTISVTAHVEPPRDALPPRARTAIDAAQRRLALAAMAPIAWARHRTKGRP